MIPPKNERHLRQRADGQAGISIQKESHNQNTKQKTSFKETSLFLTQLKYSFPTEMSLGQYMVKVLIKWQRNSARKTKRICEKWLHQRMWHQFQKNCTHKNIRREESGYCQKDLLPPVAF